jgi:hypothetical protein
MKADTDPAERYKGEVSADQPLLDGRELRLVSLGEHSAARTGPTMQRSRTPPLSTTGAAATLKTLLLSEHCERPTTFGSR